MTARRSSFIGDGLLVSWGLLTYYLVTQWRVVYDPRNSQVYAAAMLLWLALILWGVALFAWGFLRPARGRGPREVTARHIAPPPPLASPSWFATPDNEEPHDDHTDHDDEGPSDSAHAPR